MASGDYKKKRTQCRPRNPCLLIRQLVELMEHPVSTFDTPRHLQLLNEFLNASHYAFWIQDIPYIIRLYELIVKKLDTVPDYIKPLECLLYFSAVPPMMTKISDSLVYARDLQQYFTVLGYLLVCLHSDNLRKLILNAIKSILDTEPPAGFCCVPIDSVQAALEKSYLSQILAELVKIFNEELTPLLLEVVYLVCDISDTTCRKMLAQDVLDFVIVRFDPKWRERSGGNKPEYPTANDKIVHFDYLCSILWKLLNAIEKDDDVKAPSVFSLWSLQFAFRWVSFADGQKFNRNNLAALILKQLVTFPAENFQESGICEDLVVTAGALAFHGCPCPCNPNIKTTHDELDFKYKKIVWSCLHQILDGDIIKRKNLMKSFLKYIFCEKLAPESLDQYCSLSKILLKLIPKYLSFFLNTFKEEDGAVNLINLAQNYLEQPFDTELLGAFIYCINEMLKTGVSEALEMFGESGTSDTVIAICLNILGVQTLATDFQKVLGRAFCLLQILCAAGYVTNNDAVSLCLNYLKRVTHPEENDPPIDVRVTICAIHFLWECIITYKPFYRQFLREGGMYVLLDITEALTLPVKTISLGVLADTSKKSSCIPYLITWRRRGARLLPTLMEIFRNKTEKECYSNEKLEFPEPQPESKKKLTPCYKPVLFQPQCVTNDRLRKRCRFRIHGILHAIRVQFKDKVAIANSQYRLFNYMLSANDELTMLFAQNFSPLVLCEAWLNVAKELQRRRITPVDEDNLQLMDKLEGIKQWRSFLRSEIKRIIDKETQRDYINEFEAYSTLKEARLSDALDALADLRFISNCTEKMFQTRNRLRLEQETENEVGTNSNFHSTLCGLPVTKIFNQSINIQSNIIYEKKEEDAIPSPVSSYSSMSLESLKAEHSLSEPDLEC